MARVTVEDCLDHVDNRFQLVMRATRRARQIHLGAPALLPAENDKPTVIALREIADGLITDEVLDSADIPVEDEDEFQIHMPYGGLGDDRADDF